ncbi:PepSY domain-containing protein [Roseibium sp.]|uniref:PepSY domain-containing protein n=1 Tax=Roseibium sp. TaxID=1936156 RepID=UPI003D09B173
MKAVAVAGFMAIIPLPSAAIASKTVTLGETLGNNEKAIRAVLVSRGYVVSEIEPEHGKLEAEVILDGQEMEIVIDALSGRVLEMELDTDGYRDQKDHD